MQFENPIPLTTIAQLIGATLIGDNDFVAKGINEIHCVQMGDLVFVDHPKYYNTCIQSAASFIIINQKVEVPAGKALLVVENPFEAYLRIVEAYRPFNPSLQPISTTAVIGKDTQILPGVYIGNHVKIGANCIIHPNVTILDHCVIGNHVVIQAGSVIGSDAFYYNRKTNRPVQYKKMNSCGRVLIHDEVEIGASCTIDRGVTSDTIIGAGTKLDNQVHIGHDTVIGRNCLLAAQVAIAGAVTIEDEVTLWGQVGVNKTLRIEKGATILAQSGVPGNLIGNKIYFGTPAETAMRKKRELVWVKRIPKIWEKIKNIQA
ncbi:MAG: UDP-3-O-(3-hydroxymyristoyl)glucosamine N-acyltransferase [Bacteroidetes bacterium]|nr:UDP-3-O-(3-hydroxymyristoyl)glucosamine N-acyltransferase [Bacteroidota bacterium]